MPVAAAWNAPVKRRLRRCARVITLTRISATMCSVLLPIEWAAAGNALQSSLPNVCALIAIGAANPIVAEHSPVQNPTDG